MAETNLAYEKITAPSGLEVEIRSRTYAEWEAHETERIRAIRDMRDNPSGFDMAAFESGRFLRSRILACQVRDFETVKAGLTLRDIEFIEKKAEGLETLEVPLGNSEPGDGGR